MNIIPYIIETPRKAKMMKTVKTPEYWKEERYQPLIEAVTAYGNKVLIPKMCTDAWHSLNLLNEYLKETGQDYRDGLEIDRMSRLYYDTLQVFFEIYPQND